MFGLFKGFGFGYKPANDVADSVASRCMTEDVNYLVSAPWIVRGGLDRSGRFAAIAAINTKAFGLARKGSHFKFYYGRKFAGNWFAEVWSVWKSAAIASPLVVAEMSVASSRLPSAGVAQLIAGVLLTLMFLPRGLLAVGKQYSVAGTIGNVSYGPSGVLNLATGFYGLNAVISSLSKGWEAQAFLGDLVAGKAYLAGNSMYFYLMNELPGIFAVMVAAAFAFWLVAFKFVGARACAETVFNGLKYRANKVYDIYSGSFQEAATEHKAPQIAFGFLVYLVLVLGLVNRPLIMTMASLW